MAHPVADAFAQAADRIAGEPLRRGNRLDLGGDAEVILVGDIHGNRQNLARVIRFADLRAHPRRRLVLQEIIHGGPADADGNDRSVEVLMRAVRLKNSHPEQVHFLMGNHDMAQFAGQEITKEGRGACKSFEAGLAGQFGSDAEAVREAVYAFLRSLPLAARCENGAFLSHSLPGPNATDRVDWTVLDRPYAEEDFRRGGSVYEWLWGRRHTLEQLDRLAERLEAELFLLGHQPIESGFRSLGRRGGILASDHAHGQVAVFEAGRALTGEALPEHIRPIVAL